MNLVNYKGAVDLALFVFTKCLNEKPRRALLGTFTFIYALNELKQDNQSHEDGLRGWHLG